MNLFDLASAIAANVRATFFETTVVYRRGELSSPTAATLENVGSEKVAPLGFDFFENSAVFTFAASRLTFEGAFIAPKSGDEIEVATPGGTRCFEVAPDGNGVCWVWRSDDPSSRTLAVHAREKRAYFDPRKDVNENDSFRR